MPCMCDYEPSEGSKQYIKQRCVEIVLKIKKLIAIGDPLSCNIDDVHKLLDHLYDPSLCEEKKYKA